MLGSQLTGCLLAKKNYLDSIKKKYFFPTSNFSTKDIVSLPQIFPRKDCLSVLASQNKTFPAFRIPHILDGSEFYCLQDSTIDDFSLNGKML
jgi:hypothetical protein